MFGQSCFHGRRKKGLLAFRFSEKAESQGKNNMKARLEALYRSGQFSKFLSQIVDGAGPSRAVQSEQNELQTVLREELRRIENGRPELAAKNLLNIARTTQSLPLTRFWRRPI